MERTLYDALNEYIGLDRSRFHMPGHKGRAFFPFDESILRYDVTEVQGLDSLLHPSEVLARLQERISHIYGSGASFISTAGSTICIQAMLTSAGKRGKRIAMGRNSHISAINALALADMEPVWIYPDAQGRITPDALARTLGENPGCCAVYVTSPNYFGAISDIASLSEICKGYGLELLVDNAHGAHLKFTQPSMHPMDAGAFMCCDSLHKTLPVLTGGAVLHVRDRAFAPRAAKMLRLFASTSPSYLIMLSIDRAVEYMLTDLTDDVKAASLKVREIYKAALEKGFSMARGGLLDPLRITLPLQGTGYDAQGFLEHLRDHGVEPEYCSDAGCVLLAPLYGGERDFQRLLGAIRSANLCKTQIADLSGTRAERVMSVREAVFAASETVKTADAAGRISAQNAAVCPPGISIAVPGERIDSEMVLTMEKSGILEIEVVAES